MKVLLLTDGIYPFVTGGMQKHSFYLVEYLLKAGAEVSLMHCANEKEIALQRVHSLFEENTDRLQVYQVDFPVAPRFPGHYLYCSYRYSKNVFEAIQEKLHSFDFIYIQGFSGWHLLTQWKKLGLRAKIIVNFHGLEMYQQSANFKGKIQASLLRRYVKKNIRLAPFVHSLGGKLTDILLEKLKIPQDKIIVAPIGIEQKWLVEDLQQKSTGGEKIQLAFVGRNERRKGFPELMTALRDFNHPPFHLHVIGPFSGEPNVNVTWHGAIGQEDGIMKILDGCDVLVCPSYAEGMPTVILEAMSRGCAIAATNVGAVSEQVDTSNGWVFEAGNLASLKKTLEEIAQTSRTDLQKKQQASIEKIKSKFLWDQLVSKIFVS